jgi:hypothetical protein
MAIFVLMLGVFWIAQAAIAVIFKYGGTAQARWVPCYVVGNVIGVSSAYLWMLLVKQRHANVATGLAIGGGFLAQQIALALVYRGQLSLIQIVGIAAIVGGMFCLGIGGRG